MPQQQQATMMQRVSAMRATKGKGKKKMSKKMPSFDKVAKSVRATMGYSK